MTFILKCSVVISAGSGSGSYTNRSERCSADLEAPAETEAVRFGVLWVLDESVLVLLRFDASGDVAVTSQSAPAAGEAETKPRRWRTW